jgi:hypothetical protein
VQQFEIGKQNVAAFSADGRSMITGVAEENAF